MLSETFPHNMTSLYKYSSRLFSWKLNKNYKALKALQSYSYTNERSKKPKTFNVKIQTRSGEFFRFTCCRGENFN